jgi:anaerobic ribonucleoside-triphosphate reductase
LVDKIGRQYYVHQFESNDQQKAQVEATKVSWNINERIEKKIERHRLDRIVVENVRKLSATYRQNRHSYFQLEQLKKQYKRKPIPIATHTDDSKTK